MEEADNMIFINRGLKRTSIRGYMAVLLLFAFFYFVTGGDWKFALIVFPSVFFLLFMDIKYSITNENTLEFYHLFGRSKKKTIFISDISEIMINQHRLSLDYKTSEDLYPRSTFLELTETDMKIIVDELMKRNPKIIIS
ncbi:MAG: hypothetical protein Q4G63_10195 [Bacteroidia bacterium]|nr:hypothetical protein [Bacteroidia bacterium]